MNSQGKMFAKRFLLRFVGNVAAVFDILGLNSVNRLMQIHTTQQLNFQLLIQKQHLCSARHGTDQTTVSSYFFAWPRAALGQKAHFNIEKLNRLTLVRNTSLK